MSFFNGKSRDDAWSYFDRHVALIPLASNRADVRQYLLEREENAKLSTLGCYLGHVKSFGIYLDQRPWSDATRQDVILHIKEARGRQGRTERSYTGRGEPLGRYTKYQRTVMLRQFYKWLQNTEHTPLQFERMPFTKPTFDEQLFGRHDRLSQDEVISLLSATEDKRDRAIVMTLLDGGFRDGELVGFNLECVAFDDYGAKLLHAPGTPGLKSGIRKVPTRITFAAAYLRDWIEAHPYRHDETWALFTSRSNRNYGARLTASGVWSVLDRLSRRARIRHINPHMLRHTAASIRSGDGWNEEMMRLHFGWSKGSDMPSYYSHVEDDYDAFALRRAGFPVKAAEHDDWTGECSHCGHVNALDAYFCQGCQRRLLRDAS